MITKEIARLIHNCYTEIEQGSLMIEELKKTLNEKGEFEIRDHWGHPKGLELHIPATSGGYSIKKVPFHLALNVIQDHITAQRAELIRLKEVCRIQLVDNTVQSDPKYSIDCYNNGCKLDCDECPEKQR